MSATPTVSRTCEARVTGVLKGRSERGGRGTRTECIDHEGMPTSTVRSPVRAEMIGPMVEPHGQSFLTTNSWMPWPARRPSSRMKKPVSPGEGCQSRG